MYIVELMLLLDNKHIFYYNITIFDTLLLTFFVTR